MIDSAGLIPQLLLISRVVDFESGINHILLRQIHAPINILLMRLEILQLAVE